MDVDSRLAPFVETGVEVVKVLLPFTESHLLANDLSLLAFADSQILQELQTRALDLATSDGVQESKVERIEFLYKLSAAYVWTVRNFNLTALNVAESFFYREFADGGTAQSICSKLIDRFDDSELGDEYRKFFLLFFSRASFLYSAEISELDTERVAIYASWTDLLCAIVDLFECADRKLIVQNADGLEKNACSVEIEFLLAAHSLRIYRNSVSADECK